MMFAAQPSIGCLLNLVLLLPLVSSFNLISHNPTPFKTTALHASTHKLVLLRHGESTWNNENKFTGWHDCPLSEKGVKEAQQGGTLLKDAGYKFDKCYTSKLQRAIKTLYLGLEFSEQLSTPVVHDYRLNERHYGGLQGLDKQQTVDKYGKDQVMIWRRSYDIPPPECDKNSPEWPGNDPLYSDIDPSKLPLSESLKTTKERFMPLWTDVIVPEIKAGENILIAAHGNTLRALVMHLDGIPEDVITGLNIPTGVPLVYELDENMKPVQMEGRIEPLSGRYLGDLDEIRERIGAVANQTK
ncbi:hypothetical protein TrVE_jg10560 [Triparma verrucosa]|uniref:Phosphoglycerate mutase n=1 Tax=Triparma verrucosa TaxID=1606542 RepID=A0A9W7FG11_9STRA|nr:hypothetical protein TrVE_jg10560 [Triparma verrucosa]